MKTSKNVTKGENTPTVNNPGKIYKSKLIESDAAITIQRQESHQLMIRLKDEIPDGYVALLFPTRTMNDLGLLLVGGVLKFEDKFPDQFPSRWFNTGYQTVYVPNRTSIFEFVLIKK